MRDIEFAWLPVQQLLGWETFFSHIIHKAIVNSYILFQLHQEEHPDKEVLKQPQKFANAEYREELIRQIADSEEYGQPLVFKPLIRHLDGMKLFTSLVI